MFFMKPKLTSESIPNGETKEINIIESFTLKWYTSANLYDKWEEHNKVFLSEEEAKEYLSRLNEANKLLQTGFSLKSNIKKN